MPRQKLLDAFSCPAARDLCFEFLDPAFKLAPPCTRDLPRCNSPFDRLPVSGRRLGLKFRILDRLVPVRFTRG